MADVNFFVRSFMCAELNNLNFMDSKFDPASCDDQMNQFLRGVNDTYDNVKCNKPTPILCKAGDDTSATCGYTLMCSGTFKESVLAEGRKLAGELIQAIFHFDQFIAKGTFDIAMAFIGIKIQ